jgi:hypothetical protein
VRHLPEWLPGAGFKRKAKILRKKVIDMHTLPFQFVKEQLVSFFLWLANDWRFRLSV